MALAAQRDGFEWCYGRFLVADGRTERRNVHGLSRVFLPKLTPEANRALRQDRNIVKSQLKHYGLQYDEREFTGNGVKLLKKALEAGKFDSVPPSILELEQQLRKESISTRTLGELVEWTPNGSDELVNFYFLDSANKKCQAW